MGGCEVGRGRNWEFSNPEHRESPCVAGQIQGQEVPVLVCGGGDRFKAHRVRLGSLELALLVLPF